MKILKLQLNREGTTELGVIRIPDPSCTIQISLSVGTKFHAPTTVLITTHPDAQGREQTITQSKVYSILEEMVFELAITKPGVFSLHLKNGDEVANPVPFIVDPLIEIGGKLQNCSALSIQTNYCRCIGYVQDWVKNLKPVAALGYNMIHLPPFQELGDKSQYALSDQLQVSKELFPPDFPVNQRWPLLKSVMQRIETELGIVFMSDIVLNHTSPKSQWIREHPEAGFNVENSPHLESALFVDRLLAEVTEDVIKRRIPGVVDELHYTMIGRLECYITKKLKESDFKKFFTIDIDDAIQRVKDFDNTKLPKAFEMLRMRALNYGQPQRLNILRAKGVKGNVLDINYAVALYKPPGTELTQNYCDLRAALTSINAPGLQRMASVIQEIVSNVMGGIKHRFTNPDGEKRGRVTMDVPLVDPYFLPVQTASGEKYLACNGWVMNDAPTNDFSKPGNEAYLRRRLVVWTDSVKLRYGDGPSDSPFLWEHMTKYVLSVAQVVKGIRVDNAHSTPIHVAEYFIKKARDVNPSLYVMAELFTANRDEDVKYINRLGINSFMREGFHRMNPQAITSLLWESGGRSVATVDSLDRRSVLMPATQIPGVIYDQTHDNGPVHFDRLVAAGIIAMSCSPIASTRGYDDFLSFNPSVVNEYRKYPLSENMPALQRARKIFNDIHLKMANDEMDEIHAHYYGNIVSIFRCNSQTGEGVWCVSRFPGENTVNAIECPSPVESLVIDSRILSFTMHDSDEAIVPGECRLELNTDISRMYSCRIDGMNLCLNNFPVGSIVIFRTKANSNFNMFDRGQLVYDFDRKLEKIGFNELNALLFRCDQEEQAAHQCGTYGFPGAGQCFYAGIQGIVTQFDNAKDMGSPVWENIRQGNWLMDYVRGRCLRIPGLYPLEGLLRHLTELLKQMPSFMRPKFVDRIIRCLYTSAKKRIVNLMTDFVKKGDDFVQDLALTSVEFAGQPSIISNETRKFFNGIIDKCDMSLSAGLPFFSSGYMRVWGRDTFIALRGILLVPGRFEDAKNHLIAFASVVRHGLIPNLQDGCNNPRYNSRDSTWWFLQALQDYVEMSGDNIFQCKVPQLFPTDDCAEHERKYKYSQSRPVRLMYEVVQEIMEKHGNGIHFREWNAGERIDWVMTDDGFNIDVVTDWSNGFILGGNQSNCGTWMDKMGSSMAAKNRGIPATPRDGAAIEIIGLLQSTLRFLNESSEKGLYPYKGIQVKDKGFISWSDWSSKIVSNFEGWFYVPVVPEQDSQYFIEQSLVGTRGIYKDTVGSASEFGDYQFRPNLVVAMTVAPELFDPEHAVKCLDLVERDLLSEIGMRTLSPSDWRYRPDYDNSDAEKNTDYFTSSGFNYHNGPEWVWPTGYFFRAAMKFQKPFSKKMLATLAALKRTLKESPAHGLPELTNKDGSFCRDSCTTQAWSVSTVIDMLFDYAQFSEEDRRKLGGTD